MGEGHLTEGKSIGQGIKRRRRLCLQTIARELRKELEASKAREKEGVK